MVKTAVRNLTNIDFIEIYSRKPISDMERVMVMPSMKPTTQNLEARCNSIETCESYGASTDGKSSFGDSSISGYSLKQNISFSTNKSYHVSSKRSTTTEESGNSCKHEKRNKFFFKSPFKRRPTFDDVTAKSSLSKSQVLRIPASLHNASSHRGYLDRRNKKKQWERFWCVLQDSCLYCYNSPQSFVTRDVVLLRGYKIIADVINMKRSTFFFQLEQQGSPTVHFSTDNHQDFLLWVGTFEKCTQRVTANMSNATFQIKTESEVSSVSKQCLEFGDNPSDSMYCKMLEQELLELQKHKLLKEIAIQRQNIIEEQLLLDNKAAYGECKTPIKSHILEQKRASRYNCVIHKYDQAREKEEMKSTKCMALLNRRRNSAQLKVDHLTKQISPTSQQKRRHDHKLFAALETQLNLMKEGLRNIDSEITSLQTNKINTLEKIQKRQELELLITEQQETHFIMQHRDDVYPMPFVRRGHDKMNKRNALTPIVESKSTLRSSEIIIHINENSQLIPQTSSTNKSNSSLLIFNRHSSLESTSSEEKTSRPLSESSNQSSLDDITIPSASSSVISTQTSGESQAPKADEKKNVDDEIDPAVLAKIKLFEEFSKLKLRMLQKN